jgi:outer membrane protein OmpA-like peptidoglycan-associated protein
MKATSALVLATALLLSAPSARAESSALNLHFNPTLVVAPAFGGGLTAGADWQFHRGFALDGAVGGYAVSDGAFDASTIGLFSVAGGVRFRFIDSHRGYATEEGGDAPGNLFLVPRVGALIPTVGSAAASFDIEAGYEWSIARPLQAGLFVRPGVAVGAKAQPYMLLGMTFSIGVGPEIVPDTDHDGVEDALDACPSTPIGTRVDARGCTREVGDEDNDGVKDDKDQCPHTPKGAKVDERGCTIMPKKVVLHGVRFKFDSADLEPESTSQLEEVAAGLRDNPKVRVEIGGHTDDQGDKDYNQKLSERRAQSVAVWLSGHGVLRSRVVTKGYGSSRPAVANDTDEHKALNRRIEFIQIE